MQKIAVFILYFISINLATSQTYLQEGFEIWPLEDWQVILLGEATDGWRDDFEGISHTGIHSAYSSISNQQSDNWLVSPSINVEADNYVLKFWEQSKDTQYYDKATVLISSGSANPLDNDFEIVAECLQNIGSWMEQEVDLSSYEGETIYLAFRYEGTYHHWYIDDASIAPADFNDAGITNIISPTGVAEDGSIEQVVVNVQNFGSSAINEFDIEWKINGEMQPIAEFSSLNLSSGQNVDLTLGDFNFANEGLFTIEATLVLENDFDDSNNQIISTYEIAPFKDVELSYLLPEGMIPAAGLLDVKAALKNNGEGDVNIADIDWTINGEAQAKYQNSTLALSSGQTIIVDLGSFSFEKGLHEIQAELSALGDTSDDDNFYSTTIAVDTFYESFEGRIFPPEGWSIDFGTRDGVNFGDPVEGLFYYVTNVDDNFFGVVSDTLFTPVLDIEEGDHLRFYIKSNAFLSASHSLIFKDASTGEISFIQTINNSQGLNNWEFRDLDISAAQGIGQIGIASNSTGSYGETRFDLFSSDASIYQADNDLKILNGDMYFLALQDNSTEFTCQIRNAGSAFVNGNDYQLKLVESSGNELASVLGKDLKPWEETYINISHVFQDLGEKELFFSIEYLEDENQSNNSFRTSKVSVVPNSVVVDEIGSPEFRNLNIPFTPNGSTNSLGEDDLSQLLYYDDELSQAGMVYGIAYYYDNLLESDNVTKYPLQVWIAQSSAENMEEGWIPNESMTLVFDDTLTILPGNSRDLFIPFDEPVLINGLDNIIIKNYQYDPSWPPSIFRMYSSFTSAGIVRSISASDVFQLDVDNPPTFFFESTDICYTRFVIDPIVEVATLSGNAFDISDNSEIPNAEISIAGSSLLEVTGTNGDYEFPQIAKGSYTLRASAEGYIDQEQDIELIDDNQTYDFYLTRKAEINISGRIVGDNDLATGLEDVLIELRSEDSDPEVMSSGSDGEFSYLNAYGQTSYEIDIFLYGYLLKTIAIDADDTEILLGDIVLEQEFISPFDVEVSDMTSPVISWNSPKKSEKIKLQNDLGNISFSYTNEPNEEVWLGNLFPITEITTITSVEIRTDIYENAIDFVAVDVFDVTTNTLLASSEPFLVYPDSLHIIDIPNIVVYDDIAVMLRWKDNVASTNSLALDYSEEDITNSAIIRYPNQGITLLTEFFGNGAPNMSFLVRTNTLDPADPITNKEIPNYNVYRGFASEFPNVDNWKKLNSVPLTDLAFTDEDTTGIEGGELYRYAIETIYANGNSELTFSNTISGNVISSLFDTQAILDVEVFPNPAKSFLTIDLRNQIIDSGIIQIIDISGKLVGSYPIENQTGNVTLNISAIPTGAYHIKIESEKDFQVQEFIKI